MAIGLTTQGPGAGQAPARIAIAPGPFQPTWQSLAAQYECPEWFRDAKFGIWAHWTAQCVPEQGDWYARQMYIQGAPDYEYQVAHYGHPSKFGFMELDHLWKAEHWEPEKLMALYKRAGAKYFFALANHHDNFDAFNSKYHAWNSVNVGPKKDIVGIWAKAARAQGLRFGVSNHSAHAWHWFQTAYGYDGEGPLAGVRYDAATLTMADGKGKWWEGLDPQELYTGANIKMPDGIVGAKAVAAWHENNDRPWTEEPPVMNPEFTRTWALRCQDLVDKYHPDVLYFDDEELPLGQAGLDVVAHTYNANLARNGGTLDVVVNAKKMTPAHRPAVVEDIERGVATEIRPDPWQTDTCIGTWHYNRAFAEANRYKTVPQVVDMLADIVSKNGNLMLSVPLRADGTLDDHEIGFLEGLAQWMEPNGECIFGTRPWKIFGEGPSTSEKPESGQFGGAKDVRSKPYTAEDVRFTQSKDGRTLYAIILAAPGNGVVTIKSLASGSALWPNQIGQVKLLGADAELTVTRDPSGLHVSVPAQKQSALAFALKIQN